MSRQEAPAWVPDEATIARANLTRLMEEVGVTDFAALHRWSVTERAAFWAAVVERLGIVFRRPPEAVLAGGDVEHPRWLSGALLNIVDSCFTAPADRVAVRYAAAGEVRDVTYGELRRLVGRFANGFVAAGLRPGDRVAIAMTMNLESVVAYLGTVAAGGVVVSIADSFAPDEIATRLRLTAPRRVVTQDRILRDGKSLPMYEKVVAAGGASCVVVDTGGDVARREGDVTWEAFLSEDDEFDPVAAPPDTVTNILFSSGTTGEPKAIPWTETTPIKAAMDGHFHHDIHPDDVVAWPTNLGWMMGPWLIYASLVNDAAFALYDDAPNTRGFCEFVAAAGVTILGLVPSLVASWRSSGALEGVDWSRVRLLSSTGEASNPEDYRWLMERVGAPVVEYCGGTEIGGGYISGTVVQPAVPATFTTPSLGLDVRILDEEGRPTDSGELFIVPPSIGLSTELLNRDHHEVYYAGLPQADVPLRRHGDHMERLPNGYYRAHGRIDDTMNLGGIKVSSAELERAVADVAGVAEVAAVAVPPPGGGPDRLVVFAVPRPGVRPRPEAWREEMQRALRARLNPLFKIHDVVVVDALPRTASQKVMRRELRARYRR